MVFSKAQIIKLKNYLGAKSKPGKHDIYLLEKITRYTELFRRIPGIRCICVCNSLAMNACHSDSDIDLFIITKSNRLWTARIFFTLILSILGQRKTSKQHAGKFCLSFFISEENLSLEHIALQNDIYLYYWIETLQPIINRESTFESFIQENKKINNSIDLSRGPSSFKVDITQKRGKKRYFGNLFELLLKKIFLPRTQRSFQKLGKPYGVVITDTMLKFHNKDKRKEISEYIMSVGQ